MALRKSPNIIVCTLPESLDPVPQPETAQPMTWSVKPLGVGLRRQLESMLVSSTIRDKFGPVTDSTIMALLAFLTFAGTTFHYEDSSDPILPPDPTLEQFLAVWDTLPEDIARWILERIWEANPQMRPSPYGFDDTM